MGISNKHCYYCGRSETVVPQAGGYSITAPLELVDTAVLGGGKAKACRRCIAKINQAMIDKTKEKMNNLPPTTIGQNKDALCKCGSGVKYKKCCGRKGMDGASTKMPGLMKARVADREGIKIKGTPESRRAIAVNTKTGERQEILIGADGKIEAYVGDGFLNSQSVDDCNPHE